MAPKHSTPPQDLTSEIRHQLIPDPTWRAGVKPLLREESSLFFIIQITFLSHFAFRENYLQYVDYLANQLAQGSHGSRKT